ncbi:Exodeoxyribonuclease III [Lentibacillus sp. JNUCC-1]|nr:Exodeoxyribonuclease III [Lentibacillus sp. JNUCC-1]
MQQISDAILFHQADLVVLTEYKDHEAGMGLMKTLKQAGWSYTLSSEPPNKENGLLIASVYPFEAHAAPFSKKHGSHRWHEIYLPSFDLNVLGIHVPNVNETYDKRFFGEEITRYAYRRRNDRAMIVGDFNTARPDEKSSAPRKFSDYIMQLLEGGWTDAWKDIHGENLDYSWFSHKQNGFHLDYVFLSPSLSNHLTDTQFSHHEREENYSDHSILIAEFELFQVGG